MTAARCLMRPSKIFREDGSMKVIEYGILESNQGVYNAIGNMLRAAFQQIDENSKDAANRIRTEVAETYKKMDGALPEVIIELARRGWYLPPKVVDISFVGELSEFIKSKKIEQLDSMMETRIAVSLDSIRARTIQHFPNRANIINAAMNAHCNEVFELSVPILLIQSEGMVQDKWGTKLFASDNNGLVTKERAENSKSGFFTDALFLVLIEKVAITANKNDRLDFPDAYNRHEIIHGSDTDYATYQNSLKAISLLDFIASIVTKNAEDTNKNRSLVKQSSSPFAGEDTQT